MFCHCLVADEDLSFVPTGTRPHSSRYHRRTYVVRGGSFSPFPLFFPTKFVYHSILLLVEVEQSTSSRVFTETLGSGATRNTSIFLFFASLSLFYLVH